MNKFKVGDKIKVIRAQGITLKIDSEWIVEKIFVEEGFPYVKLLDHPLNKISGAGWDLDRFELVQEKNNMFDMKKDKWFIRTPTPEISEAVQLWLFEQGFEWQHFKDTRVHCTGSKFLKLSPFEDDAFCHTDSIYGKSKEIKLTFKTSVASVEYPVVETDAEKELKALEQKIQELTEQASKLRSVIK